MRQAKNPGIKSTVMESLKYKWVITLSLWIKQSSTSDLLLSASRSKKVKISQKNEINNKTTTKQNTKKREKLNLNGLLKIMPENFNSVCPYISYGLAFEFPLPLAAFYHPLVKLFSMLTHLKRGMFPGFCCYSCNLSCTNVLSCLGCPQFHLVLCSTLKNIWTVANNKLGWCFRQNSWFF